MRLRQRITLGLVAGILLFCVPGVVGQEAKPELDIDQALAKARARLATVTAQRQAVNRLAEGERHTLIGQLAAERKKLRAAERSADRAEQRLDELTRRERTLRSEAEARARSERGLRATVRRGLATLLRAERHSLVSLEQPSLRASLEKRLAAVEGEEGPLAPETLAGALDDLRAYLHLSGRIARFEAEAADARGRLADVEVFRLGQVAAYYRHDGAYGHLQLASGGHWKMLPASDEAAIATLFAERGAPRTAPVDLSGGLALAHDAEHGGFMEHLRAGGPVMIALGLLLLVALWLTAERLWFLAAARRNTRRLADLVPVLAGAASGDAVQARLQGAPGPMARAIRSALAHPVGGEAAVDQALREATPELERGLGLLGVLGTIAPFLGLLGTVTGLITTFATLTAVGTNDPRLLAGGISEALVTTQSGLILAIPILLAHAYLTGRVDDLTDRLESAAEAAASVPRTTRVDSEEASS
jgi:biopolymer transport protein ExbB